MLTLPAGSTFAPAIVNTETVPSARLATSASVPALLIDTPEAPLPACSVAMILGCGPAPSLGAAPIAERSRLASVGFRGRRSMTVSLSSGICLLASAGSIRMALATRAISALGRDRHIARRAGDAARRLDLGDHPRRHRAQVDQRHGIGRRVLDDGDRAVRQLDLRIVGRDRKLRVRCRGRQCRQQGRRDGPVVTSHCDLPHPAHVFAGRGSQSAASRSAARLRKLSSAARPELGRRFGPRACVVPLHRRNCLSGRGSFSPMTGGKFHVKRGPR